MLKALPRPAAVSAANEGTPPFALLGLGMAIGANEFTEASTSTTSLGQKEVNGLTATGSRIVRAIPSEVLGNEKPITVTMEQWVSPELGLIVQFTETSSVGGSVTYSLNQIVRAEPDPTLFTVPADYKVQNLPGVELHPSAAGVESRVSTGTTSSVSVATRP